MRMMDDEDEDEDEDDDDDGDDDDDDDEEEDEDEEGEEEEEEDGDDDDDDDDEISGTIWSYVRFTSKYISRCPLEILHQLKSWAISRCSGTSPVGYNHS